MKKLDRKIELIKRQQAELDRSGGREMRKNLKDYTTLEGQIKVQRALLLTMILVLAMAAIRYHSLHSEMEKY